MDEEKIRLAIRGVTSICSSAICLVIGSFLGIQPQPFDFITNSCPRSCPKVNIWPIFLLGLVSLLLNMILRLFIFCEGRILPSTQLHDQDQSENIPTDLNFTVSFRFGIILLTSAGFVTMQIMMLFSNGGDSAMYIRIFVLFFLSVLLPIATTLALTTHLWSFGLIQVDDLVIHVTGRSLGEWMNLIWGPNYVTPIG